MAQNDKLREERLRRGWTYKDVADQIKLPDAHTVGRWERGKSFPSPHYRRALSNLFEKNLEELGLLQEPSYKNTHPLGESGGTFSKLPVAFSSFIGRKQEVIEVGALLAMPEVRLLTLLGTGGIGKTRLGIEAATQMRDQFADGICFVSLIAVNDPASVLPALAAALAIQDSTALPLKKQVKNFLYEKQVLLFFDNFEQVASAAPLIEEILLDCPRVKVMVTSRHLLQLEAEHIFAVPSLTLPDLKQPIEATTLVHYTAVALFMQRVQTYLHDFKITESNASAIADLCVHLDGLPLAIELAAARIKLFSPQVLLVRLLQDQQILKSDLLTIPERHRTLYSTINSSYELLNAQEQWLFRRLSIFVGGFLLETVEDVFSSTVQGSATLMEIVTSLLSKSLLQRIEQADGEPRFFMLETIRHHAMQALQSKGEVEEVQQLYSGYYLALAERALPYLKTPQQLVWLTKLEQEMDNLRAALQGLIERQETTLALRFCEPFGKFCGLRGYWHEEQRWIKAVLQLPQVQEQGVRGRVLRRAGHLAYRLRDLKDARVLLEQSVACSREAEDGQNLVGALSSLGWVFYRQNEIDMTGQLLKECVNIARHVDDYWVLANALESLGRFMHYQGSTDKAYALLQESVAISREHIDQESLARILTTMVTLEVAQGNMEQASKLAEESFLLAQELGTKPLIALTLDTLGEVALFQGAYAQARQHFEERIEMAANLGDTPTLFSRKLKLADIALSEGNFERTGKLLEEASKLQRMQGDSADIALFQCISGDVKRMNGDLVEASALYQEALLRYRNVGDKRKPGRCLIGMVQILLKQEMVERAAYFIGAAEARLRPYDMYPRQCLDLQQAKERASNELGEADFRKQWEQGGVATLEQLLESF